MEYKKGFANIVFKLIMPLSLIFVLVIILIDINQNVDVKFSHDNGIDKDISGSYIKSNDDQKNITVTGVNDNIVKNDKEDHSAEWLMIEMSLYVGQYYYGDKDSFPYAEEFYSKIQEIMLLDPVDVVRNVNGEDFQLCCRAPLYFSVYDGVIRVVYEDHDLYIDSNNWSTYVELTE